MAVKSKTKAKGVFVLRLGDQQAEIRDTWEIGRLIKGYLETLLPPGTLSLTSKQTGKKLSILPEHFSIAASVKADVDDFIQCNNVVSYRPNFFSRVFARLACVVHTGEIRSTSFRDTELLKLVRSGYLSKEKVTEKVKAPHSGYMRTVTVSIYKPLQKALDLVETAKNLPAKKINPSADDWQSILRGDPKSQMTLTAQMCGLYTNCVPPDSKLNSLYQTLNCEAKLSVKAEEAFLRQVRKIAKGLAFPRWAYDYRKRTRTLKPPTKLHRALVNLVPKDELSVLLTGKDPGSGQFYKMILNQAPDADFQKVVVPY